MPGIYLPWRNEEIMKECCKNEKNLYISVEKNGTFKICKVCGCKHYMMVADTGKLGLSMG